VRRGALPTFTEFDFRPYTFSGNETVTVNAQTTPALSGGIWYCSVHGYEAGSFLIRATFTVESANGAPFILSGATANPNPANVGGTVQFGVVADDPDDDPLSYTWSFGDGGSAAGANPSHAYQAAGTYSVTVVVSDGVDSVSDTLVLTVNTANTPRPFTVLKMVMKLNFRSASRDSMVLKGSLVLPAGFAPEGVRATVDVGGVRPSFVLDARGRARSLGGRFKLSTRNGSFLVKLSRGNFAGAWADEGLINADLQRSVSVNVRVELDAQSYTAARTLYYKARAGRSGRAR